MKFIIFSLFISISLPFSLSILPIGFSLGAGMFSAAIFSFGGPTSGSRAFSISVAFT